MTTSATSFEVGVAEIRSPLPRAPTLYLRWACERTSYDKLMVLSVGDGGGVKR
jgi:hypothetical protein